jgi:hypothetical protein
MPSVYARVSEISFNTASNCALVRTGLNVIERL